MILAFIARAWAGLIGLPRGWHYAMLGAAAMLGVWLWHRDAVNDAVEADRLEHAIRVQETAQDAERAANRTLRASEAANTERVERAREAGEASDDPLKAVLDSLRGGK